MIALNRYSRWIEMLIRELIAPKQPLTPEQQQAANIKQQQKSLKLRKARLAVQASQSKLAKAQNT